MPHTTPTLSYYDTNAEQFAGGTAAVDFSGVQTRFAALIPAGGCILDFGCGSGRDVKWFHDRGFAVDAVDGSARLCELASAATGLPVRQMLFSELDECEKYDGIWACASILHLPKAELRPVLTKMVRATRPGGHIYVSFKYGDFEGERGGRFYTDLTETSFRELIGGIPNIMIVQEWTSADVRPGRGDEKWLNVILVREGSGT